VGELRPWHIVVLVVVLILLFGAKRLPDGARSLGRSMRIFKAETEGLMKDDSRKKETQPERAPRADE
jgi:sec-independent protein translocase protein TatA